jgi:DNA-binding transcriptional MerR regulator
MEWTLDELVGRVAQALAGADVRAPNGRVSEVPDTRMIRWYMSTGLVDRPLAMRGRVGLYGRRHLLQLVAIKRLQSQGRSLAAIQAELAGAADAALETAARLSEPADAAGPLRRERFWTQRPAPTQSAQAMQPTQSAQPALSLAPGPEPDGPSDGVLRGDGVHADGILHGVVLDGAVLLLPRVPSGHDLAAIRTAAQPLLDLLDACGLLTPRAAIASVPPKSDEDEGARG